MTKDEETFWMMTYMAELRAGHSTDYARQSANTAVLHLREAQETL